MTSGPASEISLWCDRHQREVCAEGTVIAHTADDTPCEALSFTLRRESVITHGQALALLRMAQSAAQRQRAASGSPAAR